jgi:hypothetical protein
MAKPNPALTPNINFLDSGSGSLKIATSVFSGAHQLIVSAPFYKRNIDSGGNGNITYIGDADPSSATSDAGWSIKKIVIEASTGSTSITWADGNASFDNIWDDHLTLNYS